MSIPDALELYGLGSQGAYGDVQGDRPNIFDVVGWKKWDAWANYRGWNQVDARRRFCEKAESILASKGFNDLTDPDKARIEREYNDCVNDLRDRGISQEAIAAEKQRIIDEKNHAQ